MESQWMDGRPHISQIPPLVILEHGFRILYTTQRLFRITDSRSRTLQYLEYARYGEVGLEVTFPELFPIFGAPHHSSSL